MTETTLKITGMHCASCSTILTKALQKVPGVKTAVVNYATEKAKVEFDDKAAKEEDLIAAVKGKGYGAMAWKEGTYKQEALLQKLQVRKLQERVMISAALSLPALLLSMVFMSVPFR